MENFYILKHLIRDIQKIICLNKIIIASHLLLRMYEMVMGFSCTCECETIHLKLGELQVLSTKNFFKIFEESKSRPIEKIHI